MKQVRFLIAICLSLTVCVACDINSYTNPVDPGSSSYQGYPTVADVSSITAVSPSTYSTYTGNFTVSKCLNATAYQLDISTTSSFTTLVFTEDDFISNIITVSSSKFVPAPPMGFYQYYWRVRAKSSSSWGAFTTIQTLSSGITTVAGTGAQGYSGDGGVATSAELSSPSGVALDSSGNLYIADFGNNCIRKVTASTGIITTVAGTGVFGYSGDGGTATSAKLGNPSGVALDASGNLYIADESNRLIRKVTASTGIIITVAGGGNTFGDGGAATSAELDNPSGVALDSSGNLYIADEGNNRIRKVTASTGIITTVAGGTSGYGGDGGAATAAALYGPAGVALDSSGNLYIADLFNNCIRKVTASTGIITTVAGNRTGGYIGDGGAATAAELVQPEGVALDSSGNLYIADGNNRIRMVTASTGIITTVAGGGNTYIGDGGAAISAELSSPHGVALDASGNLYIADEGNGRIRVVP
jgi:hypothetical protein